MSELIRVTRGEDVADIRPEWLDEWKGWGWTAQGGKPMPDLTREGIAAMAKADVIDLLEAHGWDGDKRVGVEKLRDALIGIVFVAD